MVKIALDSGTTVAVPEAVEQIADQLLDTNWVANNIKQKADLVGFLNKAYETANGKDAGVLAEQIQLEVAAKLKELHDSGDLAGPKIDVHAPPRNMVQEAIQQATMNNPNAMGARLSGMAPSLGGLGLVASGRDTDSEFAIENRKILNAYSGEVGSQGGVLIPEDYRATLLGLDLEGPVVTPRATILPMSTRTVEIPMIDVTSHASTLFGGVQTYWMSEAETMTESNVNFGSVRLEVDTHTGYAEIPNEQEADSLFIGAYFGQTFPKAMAYGRDEKFIRGTGVGEPLGVLNSTAMVTVAKEPGQTAATLVYENVVNMLARLHPSSWASSVWVMNQELIPELMTMALSVGTGGAPVFAVSAVPGMPMTLLGRPIIFSEKMDALGTAGDIALLDLSFYLIGDRQTATLDTSTHHKFQNNKTAYRLVERVGGRPWLESALTPRQGTNTLSPFVRLATRA